ncbi:transcription antitermination factor NusB [Emticicia sp. CRIBPO]|jgi:N utilization substance protein B|uniref:transcription antitermination factor NusB n=1 Tax=Emticicia sp. CRIBPO TaxID=2683258 RepID=UPI001E2B25D4|nr:transcription antitermination factor NusB [Emticicia sp. CRIBPO]
MQALYAYEKAKGANFLLAQDIIEECFAPDLNSMEKQDKSRLQGLSKLAQNIFQDENSLKPSNEEFDAPSEVTAALKKARDFFKIKNKKDYDNYSLQCIMDAEKVYDHYLSLLNLLILIAKKHDQPGKDPGYSGLHKNKIIKALTESKELETLTLKRGANWEKDQVFINKFFNEAIKNNAKVVEYSAKVNHTAEEDLAIIKYLVKNVLLKHELASEHFEKVDIYWSEDRDILRSMITHTLQDFPDIQHIDIQKLDETWDDSREFLTTLFRQTILKDDELLEYLVPVLKNWDFDRISETDRILLKMGIIEMINYPAIPVKVTINEIIEISKNFSTPKSGQFVNGILDTVSKNLVKDGIIKKSGRGMLDNK